MLQSKQKISKINNLTLFLIELTEEQTKPKVSGRKKITIIREVINKIETRKTTEKIKESNSFLK